MMPFKFLSRSFLIFLILLAFLFTSFEGLALAVSTSSSQSMQGEAPHKKRIKKKSSQKRKFARGFKGAVLYNKLTNKVVYSNRANVQVAPASLTKILTMFVAQDIMKEKKINLYTKVTVSRKAAMMPGSRMGLKEGEVLTLDQLFHGMAIASGNDASVAVAEYFAKSESSFVRLMNQKARQLGMTRSVFKNASGYPAKGQYTTAKDMLELAKKYLDTYPKSLQDYHSYRTYTYNGVTLTNANPFLGIMPGADGLKTGFTAAGYNLITTVKRNNVRIIGVILGSPSSTVRAKVASTLVENAFAKKINKVAHVNSNKKSYKKRDKQEQLTASYKKESDV